MNSKAIILPDVEDLYAEEQEVVHRDFNFFSRGLPFLICLPQPKRHKRTNINRDHYGAHDRLVEAYFSEHPMFLASRFEERLILGITPWLKCTSAIRQLGYDTVPDALDEYLQMGEATSRLSLEHFCRGYYLCDEIYSEWVSFVKSVSNLMEDERARKDVEHAFGALKKN
ncbi:ALP1-like protein [Tanacetum coccineum]